MLQLEARTACGAFAFERTDFDHQFASNTLPLCLQPDKGIHAKFETKVPGTIAETRSVEREYNYRGVLGECPIPEAYERGYRLTR